MDQVNQILENLRGLGFDQEKVDGTMKLLYEDIQAEMFADFADKGTDEDISEYEVRIKEAKSVEHFDTIIKELGLKVYGDDAESILIKKLVEKLQQVEDMAKNMKDNLEKYQAGDPDTVKAVNEAAQTQDAQDLAQMIVDNQ